MQTVNARIDQALDHLVDGAAGVEDRLVAMIVGLVGEAPEPGHDKLVELHRATDQVELCAEIVTEEEAIHLIPGHGKETLICLVVELADAVRDGLHHLGMGVHLDHIVIHPEEIHDIVVEAGPKAAGAVDIPCPAKPFQTRVEGEVVRIGPREYLDFGSVLAVGKGASLSVSLLRQSGIEHSASVRGLVGIEPLRADPAKVISELQPRLFLGSGSEIGMDGGPALLLGITEPQPTAVSRLAGDDGLDSFATVHGTIL